MARSWDERYKTIVEQFPEVETASWSKLFKNDHELFASILKDVLKAEGRGSTPGKRPSLSKKEAAKQFAAISRSDFSDLNFFETFSILSQGRSVRNIASKTGLSKTTIHKLMSNERQPSFDVIEKIAKGFGKKPEFFLEYRIAFVLLSIDNYLKRSPETATNWFFKINGKALNDKAN